MKLSVAGFTLFLNRPCGEANIKVLSTGAHTPGATDALNIALPFQQIFDGPEMVTDGAVSTEILTAGDSLLQVLPIEVPTV